LLTKLNISLIMLN